VGDVLDLYVERRWVKQVETAAAQHALPRARSALAFHPVHLAV